MRRLWNSLSSSPTWNKHLVAHGVWDSYSSSSISSSLLSLPSLPFLPTPHSPRTAGPVQIHHFQPNVANSLLLLQHRLYPGPARRDRLARVHAPPRCLLLGTSWRFAQFFHRLSDISRLRHSMWKNIPRPYFFFLIVPVVFSRRGGRRYSLFGFRAPSPSSHLNSPPPSNPPFEDSLLCRIPLLALGLVSRRGTRGSREPHDPE